MDTKRKFLNVAARQFATAGFDRTSISSIANKLGLTKQALLHHFGTKEKLYGEGLRELSERHLSATDIVVSETSDPKAQLEGLLMATYENALANPLESQLLMRELIDNERRANTAEVWFLKPVLETFTDVLLRLPAYENASRTDALTSIYQLLGAINYFAISQPTLKQMLCVSQSEALKAAFPAQLSMLIHAVCAGNKTQRPTHEAFGK